MTRCIVFLLLFSINLYARGSDTLVSIENLSQYDAEANRDPSIEITGPWLFMKGDNPAWADSAFDDSHWIRTNSNLDTLRKAPGFFNGMGWFRTRVNVAPEYAGKVLALMITQSGASEIYIDGELVHTFGMICPKNPFDEHRYDPQYLPMAVTFRSAGAHVIAIRYADARAEEDAASGLNWAPGFVLKIGQMRDSTVFHFVNSAIVTSIFVFYFTFFIALSILHLIIFLFYKTNRSNLYYSIFAGAFGLVFLFQVIRQNFMDPDTVLMTSYLGEFLSCFYGPALLAMLYSIFYGKIIRIYWLWFGLFALDFIFTLLRLDIPYFGFVTYMVFCVESIRVIIASIIRKREGAWIIGSGVMITVFFLLLFAAIAAVGDANLVFNQRGLSGLLLALFVMYVTLSIPLHMSVYLAKDFARTSRNLEKKLIEVEDLSAKTVQQEKEKQKILAEQNDLLEQQVKERTAEITEQKKVIEEKNKDITDSIHYAKKIQEAMLPADEFVRQLFPKSFVLFRPKDIVSGDFYWVAEQGGFHFIAAVDCTGHGVPGALMSMTGNNFLNQIVLERNTPDPAKILNELEVNVRRSLKQDRTETESKDGMDIALCRFNPEMNELVYAGANRPLWIVRNRELLEYKPTKHSIGGSSQGTGFTEEKIALQSGDCIYIFSDGYADQFGGPEGKKFMSRKMKNLLAEICTLDVAEQKKRVESELVSWMGNITQVDDVLVIGIQI